MAVRTYNYSGHYVEVWPKSFRIDHGPMLGLPENIPTEQVDGFINHIVSAIHEKTLEGIRRALGF